MGTRAIDDAFSCQGALADTHDHSAPRNSRREVSIIALRMLSHIKSAGSVEGAVIKCWSDG